MAATKVTVWVEDHETVVEKLSEVLGFNPQNLVVDEEPQLQWSTEEAAQPDPEFIARLVALIGAPMAAALLRGSASDEHEAVLYVQCVPKPFFYDADPERAANKIADEARETVYNVVLDRQKNGGEHEADDEGDDEDDGYISG